MSYRLTLADVRAAEERIPPHLAPTPRHPRLAAAGTGAGADVDLRLELECWLAARS